MRFSVMLYGLYIMLKLASHANGAFRKYIHKSKARVLIKTADGSHARMFIFHNGKVSTLSGDREDFDVAMVWKDAQVAYRVMNDKNPDASFNAAAEGKLWVEGMGVYVLWFEEGIRLAL